MERPLQQGAASLLLGLPASRTCHPAGHRTAATHTSRHAVVSLDPGQNPGQATPNLPGLPLYSDPSNTWDDPALDRVPKAQEDHDAN